MNRDEIIKLNPLERVLRDYGAELKGSGKELSCRCLFHEDKRASMSVNVEKQTWYCHACDIGGSVIDLMARKEGVDPVAILKRFADQQPSRPAASGGKTVKAVYPYTDENGKLLYEVVRFEPKDFRQRRPDGKGGYLWNLEGQRRVLFGLQELKDATEVWIVEGEKDCLTLARLGRFATCNVCGAGKWLESYNEYLKGKDVIVCPDNDDPGRKHADKVIENLQGVAKSIRRVEVPAPSKDVSDFVATFPSDKAAADAVVALAQTAKRLSRVDSLPIYSMTDLEAEYQKYVKEIQDAGISLSKWLPSLGTAMRTLVPGELVVIMADTGIGSRYERLSNVAESMKVIAKNTNTVLVCSSQVARPEKNGKQGSSYTPSLHDAKDSGSIEASAGYVIAAWRPAKDQINLKILKSTRTGSSNVIECNFDVATLRITERLQIDPADMPHRELAGV